MVLPFTFADTRQMARSHSNDLRSRIFTHQISPLFLLSFFSNIRNLSYFSTHFYIPSRSLPFKFTPQIIKTKPIIYHFSLSPKRFHELKLLITHDKTLDKPSHLIESKTISINFMMHRINKNQRIDYSSKVFKQIIFDLVVIFCVCLFMLFKNQLVSWFLCYSQHLKQESGRQILPTIVPIIWN